jgi:hypothetical protein
MYIRLTRGQMDPAKWDELAVLAPEIAAARTSQPGCRSCASAGDRGTGKTITVTTWDTEEQTRGLVRDAVLADLMPRLHAAGVQLDPPEIYESF